MASTKTKADDLDLPPIRQAQPAAGTSMPTSRMVVPINTSIAVRALGLKLDKLLAEQSE